MATLVKIIGLSVLAFAVLGILAWQDMNRVAYEPNNPTAEDNASADNRSRTPAEIMDEEAAAHTEDAAPRSAKQASVPVISEPSSVPVVHTPPPSASLPAPLPVGSSAPPSVLEPVSPAALNEAAILAAVVKIRCPATSGGYYIGSGFSVGNNTVVTAAHVVMDSATSTCTVIFPRDRAPAYYLTGEIWNLSEVRRRHDEDGIDVAVLKLPVIETYPEAYAIFSAYPVVPYPVCAEPEMLGDATLHFGYPSNYLNQNYLSRLEGTLESFADITGIENAISEDQTHVYKAPLLGYSLDEERMHPYLVSRVASFYGDSGGMGFNSTKRCILGPHRGGTIGKTEGENYTLFMNLGWEKAGVLIR